MIKNVVLSLLSLGTLSVLTVPAMADQVIMQQTESYLIQEGKNHRGVQESTQIHRSHTNTKPSESYGSVQTNVQEAYQSGNGSRFRQTTIQRNEMRGRIRQGIKKK